MEKLPYYRFSWIVSFQKQSYHICEDEEEDVRRYWITLRTGEDTLIWMRKL